MPTENKTPAAATAVPETIKPAFFVGIMPVYWGSDTTTMQEIESSGVNIYYIIGIQEHITYSGVNNNVQKTTWSHDIFRIEKSRLGRAITVPDSLEIGLKTAIKPSAVFYLPPIPWLLVKKMDAFFRAMWDKHGTEATLILTYDETYWGTADATDGWGCFSPVQENTSGKCEYDMDAVMAAKPQGVSIVGTIHSHPEMPAYASSIDHKDQANWEGVHITFGWAKDSKKTDTHQELILGGKQWTLSPAQLYGEPEYPDIDLSIVEEWGENVSKKAQQTSTTSHYGYSGSQSWQSNTGNTGGITRTTGHLGAVRASEVMPNKLRSVKIPVGGPDPRQNLIIASTTRQESHDKCPFCDMPLSKTAWNNGRCIGCHSFIIPPLTSVKDLQALRDKRNQPYLSELDITKAPKPIIIWVPAGTSGLTEDSWSADQRDEALCAPKL